MPPINHDDEDRPLPRIDTTPEGAHCKAERADTYCIHQRRATDQIASIERRTSAIEQFIEAAFPTTDNRANTPENHAAFHRAAFETAGERAAILRSLRSEIAKKTFWGLVYATIGLIVFWYQTTRLKP